MFKAIFDQAGLPSAFYRQDIHGDNIPQEAVDITEEQWLELINNAGRRRFDVKSGSVLEYESPVATLAEVKARLSDMIDARAAAIYNRWTRFEAEYRARETAAQAFKDAGYQGEPGLYVTSFAEPAGLTARTAADAILAQAAALRAAQDALASLRMRKYEVARTADVTTAQTLADEIVAAMDEIAKGIA